jgi:hypothetical protein
MVSIFIHENDRDKTYRDSEACCHAVKIVRVLTHGHHLRNNRGLGPLNTEYLSKLLEVLCSSLSDREDCVSEPAHAEIAELLIEELDSKLTCEERNIFNDSKTHTPLLILSQLDNSGKKGLGEKLDTNDCTGLAEPTSLDQCSHLC